MFVTGLLLAGCTAQGDLGGATGGIDLDPDTDISGFKCTAYAGGIVTPTQSGGGCELEAVLGAATEVCDVQNGERAADGNPDSFATLLVAGTVLDPLLSFVGLATDVGLLVDLPGPVSPGGSTVAAFEGELPGGMLEVELLESIHVTTWLNGALQETTDAGAAASSDPLGLIHLDILGLLGSTGRFLAGFVPTQPYNQISISVGGPLVIDVDDHMYVYDVCTAAQPPAG